MCPDEVQGIAVPAVNISKGGIADTRGLFQHGGKDGLKVAGGTTDGLKHLRRGRLLLKGLAQFLEQPCVLYGNDGLTGKVRDQGDLLVSERKDLLTEQANRTDQFVLLQHWDSQTRPYAAKFDCCNVFRVALFAQHCCIGNMTVLPA
jgi:hypothetical protein